MNAYYELGPRDRNRAKCFPSREENAKSIGFMDHPASEAQLDTFLGFLNLKMFCLHRCNPLKIMPNFKQEITYRVQKSK